MLKKFSLVLGILYVILFTGCNTELPERDENFRYTILQGSYVLHCDSYVALGDGCIKTNRGDSICGNYLIELNKSFDKDK
jgi:hypothetical protein